ncbi:MAG: hypothetical protein RL264_1967, partial [Bacteroidota bacterium]
MKNSRSHINCIPKAFLNSGVKFFLLLVFALGGNWGWGQTNQDFTVSTTAVAGSIVEGASVNSARGTTASNPTIGYKQFEWTVPPNVCNVRVEVWGAGGGGSGRPTSSYAGAGGGGGAYARKMSFNVTPGQILYVQVGRGGQGSNTGNTNPFPRAAFGGTSYVKTGSHGGTVIASADGGDGAGNGSTSSTGGGGLSGAQTYAINGTAPTTNDIGYFGGNGGGGGGGTRGGGGGGGAGSGGPGGNGGSNTISNPPGGAAGIAETILYTGLAGSTGGSCGSINCQGSTPGVRGGGGGGSHSGCNCTGGDGGDGFVRITYSTTSPSTPSVIITSSDADNTICAGNSVTFTATPTNGGATPSYQWVLNGSNVGTNSATYTTTTLTSGATVSVIMTTSLNCVSSSTASSNIITTTVNPLPTTPSAITGTTSICPSTATTYSVTNVAGVTYNWSYSGTGTITGSGNSISLSATTGGTLSVTASNSCGTSAASTQAITMTSSILWANTQSPASGVSCSNDNFNVYGQVYIPGVTEGAGQGANVTAQLGYSITNPDPSTWTNWVNVTYNSAVTGNNDEYMGTLSGLAGNTYYYAFRYSYNGCAYVYGGYSAPSAPSNTWTVNTNGGSAFVGNSTTNGGGSSGGINSSNGVAFGLYNNSGTTTEAIRNFPSLLVGQTVRFDMDNGWLNSGSVGVGLQNTSGQNVWEIFFAGGAAGYSINGSLLSPTVPFTANGLRITFTLLTTTTYSATIQILNGGATYGPYTGSLLNPGGGQSISRFRAFNFNSGPDGNYNFYFNNIVTPSFFDNASTYSSLSNGLQSTTSVGGIWNSPTIGNGTLTVTTSPTPSNAGSTQTICEGTSATLAANAPSPSTATGAWTITSGPNNDLAQFNNASSNVAVFTPTLPGTYVLRWTITNGSCSSFSEVTINVTSGILNFVNTQFPGSAAICVGQSANVYGQVFEPGVTPNAGQGANIEVQVGYVNSSNTDPPNSNSWTNWSNATYNTAVTGNNDEYIGTFGSALSAGTYYYAFRYRLNGCAWQYGGYSIGGGGTWDGTNNKNGILTIYSNTPTAMTPSSICAGVSNIAVTGSNAGSYELLVNGVSQGVPSTTNSWTIPGPLVASDQVCVRGYAATNLITMDGALNEAFWSPALVNSAGGATSGTQNRINALYVKNAHGFLNIGIAGRLVAGEDRKILLFVDSKNGGHNSLSTWTNRTGVTQNNGLKNLNGGMQFDPGFTADYAISIGTNSSGESFLDFYDMVTNTNNYLGSTINQPTRIAYQANTNAADYTKGYEIRIPINLFGTITSPMKFFAMLTNNPTDISATTLSNQFLSPASNGQGDYGDGPVNFGNAAPNPVSYVLESDCYTDVCRTVVAPTTPTFTQLAPICSGASLSALPTTSTNGITGTWAPALDNTQTTTYTFTPTAGLCATTTTMTITVNPLPSGIANSNSPFCAGQAINLTATDGFSTYTWSGPNSFSNATQNPSISNAQAVNAGTYTLTVTDGNGCQATSSTVVSLTTSPTAGNNGPVCVGGELKLSTNSATSYSWSGPNSFTSNLQNPTVSASATTAMAGTYTVSVVGSCAAATGVVDNFSDGNFTANPVWTPQAGGFVSSSNFLKGNSSVTDDIISTPSTQVYGTWNFDYRFHTTAYTNSGDQFIAFFISSTNAGLQSGNGYYVYVESSGQLRLTRRNGNSSPTVVINSSISGTNELNTNWHTIKVIRGFSGQFELYFDGVLKGTGTDNTYTTSTHLGPWIVGRFVSDNHEVDNISCSPAATASTTVTVNPNPTISTTGTATSVCINTNQQTTSLTYTATTNSPISYSIDWNTVANTAGLVDQASTNFSFVATGGTLTGIVIPANTPAGTYSGIMTIANANGCTSTQAISVTVNPSVTINPFSPATSTRCQGAGTVTTTTTATNSTSITYSIDGTSSTGGVTMNASTGAVTYPSTWSGTTTITASAAGCNGPVSTQFNVTVNPTPTISAKTGTICSGNTYTMATASPDVVPALTTYSWTFTANPSITGAATGTAQSSFAQTLTNTSSMPQTIVYSVTPTVGSCSGTPFTVTITVDAPLNGGTVSTDQTICSGGIPTTLTSVLLPSGGSGLGITGSVQIGTQIWMNKNLDVVNYNDGTPVGTDFTGTAGAYTWYNNSYPTWGQYYGPLYNWYAVNTGNLCPVDWHVPTRSEWNTLINYVGNTLNAGKKLKSCRTVTYGCPTTLDPRWDADNTAFGTDDYGFAILPAGRAFISNGILNFERVRSRTRFWASTQNDVSNGDTYEFNDNSSGVNVFNHPKNEGYSVRCMGDNANTILNSYTYQWQQSVGCNNVWTDIPLANESTYSPGALTQTTCFRRMITDACGTAYSNTITITVNPAPAITAMTSTICSGATFTATPVNGTNGTVPAGTTYTWSAPVLSPASSITGGSAQAVAQTSVSQTLTNTTTSNATATYTVTATSGSCSSNFTLTVTVLPPIVTGIVNGIATTTYGPGHLVIYQVYGGGTSAGATYTNDFVVLYNPTASSVNLSGWSLQYASATGSGWGISPSPLSLSGTIQSGGYFLISLSGNTSGLQIPTPDLAAGPPTITGGITVSATAGKIALLNSTVPLNGTCPTNGTIVDFVGFGTNANCFEGTGFAPTISATTWLTRALNGCQDTDVNSADFTAGNTLAPKNSTSPTNFCTTTSNTQTICAGQTASSITATAASGANGSFSYQWYSQVGDVACPTGSSTAGWTPVAGETNLTYSPGAVSVTTTFALFVTATGTNNCGGSWANDCRKVIVISPIINNITTIICSGAAFSVTPTNGTNGSVPSGTTYSWAAPSVPGITGTAAGTNASSISGTLTNTTNAPITVSYTVTPVAGSCTGATFTVSVTVNPTPTVTNMTAVTCSGTAVTVTPTNGSNGNIPSGTTFTWGAPTQTGVAGGTAGSGTSLTASLTGNGTAVYTLTPSFGSCTGNTFTATISVEPCLPFTSCNLVVYRVGDGSAIGTNNSAPVSIQEITASGSIVQTISAPFTGSTLLTQNFTAASVGLLNSFNGQLSVPGYSVSSGTALDITSPINADLINKVNSILDSNGVVQSYTSFPTSAPIPFSGDHLRGTLPISATNFYATGAGGNSGLYYFNGSSFNFLVSTTARGLEIFNNQLYISTSSNVFQVGTGLPTSGTQIATGLLTTYSNPGIYDFSISPDGCTMYVADNGNNDSYRGVCKYRLENGAWTRKYNYLAYGIGLVVDYSGTNDVIYVTTATNSSNTPNKIEKLIDNPSGNNFTVVTTGWPIIAPSNYRFAGIDFTPNSTSATISNTNNVSAQNSTVCQNGTATTLTVASATSSNALTYQWYSNTSNDLCGATAISGATNATYSPPTTSPDTTYYFAKISSNCATVTYSSIATVIVNPNPTPTITGNAPLCSGSSITLTANPSGQSYSWSPGGQTTQAISVSSAGNYTVTVTDSNNCSAQASATVSNASTSVITN